MKNNEIDIAQKRFYISLFYPTVFIIVCVLVKLVEVVLDRSFAQYGILPREIESLTGILFAPFIHGDGAHLFSNAVSILILMTTLFYFYRDISFGVILFSMFAGNTILWFIGRESWHIGASVLTYGIAFFLFFSGIIRRHIQLMAISMIVVFLYGSMVWHLFPLQINDPISWEGHLSGALVGVILAVVYRKKGPQPKVWKWEEEENPLEDENNTTENDLGDMETESNINSDKSTITN